MSAKENPFLKKASGAKPPTRAAMRKAGGLGNAPRGGLGRGLGALVDVQSSAVPPAPVPVVSSAGGVLKMPPMDIERCPWQPRVDFDEASLKELADSIRANGVIQPLVCRRRADGKLELIAGERRLRASVMAGLDKVPVVLVDASDRKAAEMAVIENIQRRDLNVIEEAEGYRLLKEQFELRQEDVADRVGKSRPAVANALRLLELPDEVKQLLTQNLISTGHAKVLLSVEDEKERIILARDCVSEGLTVRALERKIARRHEPVSERPASRPDMPDSHVRAIVDELHHLLGCAVRLTSGRTLPNGRHVKGVLEIDFADNDGLDRVLSALGVRMDG